VIHNTVHKCQLYRYITFPNAGGDGESEREVNEALPIYLGEYSKFKVVLRNSQIGSTDIDIMYAIQL